MCIRDRFCTVSNGRYDRVALVYDVRTANSFTEFFEVLDKLKACLLYTSRCV